MPTDKEQGSLCLPRTLVNQVLAHAQQHPDVEVCGLIGLGLDDNKSYYPVKNIADEPARRFLMDPSQQIDAMKSMRGHQQKLLAIVHSHPSSGAVPSSVDIDQISYDDVFYIIISLNTKGVLEMRAYLLHSDTQREVELLLEDT